MSTGIHTQWAMLQSKLEDGQHSAVEAFDFVRELLIQMTLEDRSLADELIQTLPARSRSWPQAKAIRLGIECARIDRRRWRGDAESCLACWRVAKSEVIAIESPALTSLYSALFASQLYLHGQLMEALEIGEKGLRALQLGPNAGAEVRLRILVAQAAATLGLHQEAIKLFLAAEDVIVARGMGNWRGRSTNLGSLAYSMFELEDERASEGGLRDADSCKAAMGFASKAIDLIDDGPRERFRANKVCALHTLARLNFLVGNVDEARSCYQRIDEELKVPDPSLHCIIPALAPGRALIEIALGNPERALLLLDEAHHELVGKRSDSPTLEWWKVRSEVMVAMGRWREAHEAQLTYMNTWWAISRQRAEALASLSQRRLDTYNASALQFLSHDLRAPLSSIVALARASAEGGSPETMRRLTTLAERASHIAGRSIDYMRALLAEEADFQLLDLTTVLDDACEDTEALGADKFVTLRRDLRGPAWVMGDQDLLRRAFANLLTNAIRYAPAESAVSITLAPASSESWRVVIADEGPGFDPAQLNLLHAQTHPSSSGHGLGLAFVARAMSKHDVTPTVLKNNPRGALVQMQFHAARAADEAAASQTSVATAAKPVHADSA